MVSSPDTLSMALFCDFENVALGVREANHDKFDIRPVLERLLLKGSITVKKAYCDWERYKAFKAIMHEANFELIEIPHVRQSGKNSADIRLVVDALDLCYTKAHVNTFVIISGDSDFSPLVSKLRENAKQVIGVGVKHSTSDLLVANCDEFIFYDDLVKNRSTPRNRQGGKDQPAHSAVQPIDTHRGGDKPQTLKDTAIAMTVETFDALLSERGDSGKIWASTLKQAIKRRKPDFTESYYGFRAFGNLLDEAQARGLLAVGKDEKSGTFVYRPDIDAQPASGDKAQATATAAQPREPRAADATHNDVSVSGGAGETASTPARKKARSTSRKPRTTAPAQPDATDSQGQAATGAGSHGGEAPAQPADATPKTAAKTARKSTRRTATRKKPPDDAA